MLELFFKSYWLPTLLTALVGYLLGSISFSIIITRIYLKDDIRKYGSGNAGATNVLRSVGKLPAMLTFAGDFLKQVASILIGRQIFLAFIGSDTVSADIAVRYAAYIAGVGCLIGHLYPLYFRLRGGKGVITAAAMMALIDWRVFLIELVLFAIVMACTRLVSLGSIIGGLTYPLVTFLVTYFIDYKNQAAGFTLTYVIVTTCITAAVGLIVTIKHRSNIKRLLNGTEKPISFAK